MHREPVAQLLSFVREQYRSGPFKEFYDGDPDLIPKANLPCIAVQKESDQTSIDGAPTGFQRVNEVLVIKLIFDKQDDYAADISPTNLTEKRIRDAVEARDPETGKYLSNTLKHAVMHRFSMKGVTLNQTMSFDLGLAGRENNLITQEGHLRLTITYLVPNVFDS